MDNNININNQNSEWFESPLLFFENLLYYKHFNFLKSNFALVSEGDYDNFGTYYDESKDAKISFYQNSETGEPYEDITTFSDYITEIVIREGINTLKKTNEIALNLRDKGHKEEFLESIVSDISFLLKVLSNFEEVKEYDVIEKRLKSIENHIQIRHKRLLGANERPLENDLDNSVLLKNKQELKNMISKGTEGLGNALTQIKEKLLESNSELLNESIQLLSQFNDLYRGKNLNTNSSEDENRINKVTLATLKLLDKIE